MLGFGACKGTSLYCLMGLQTELGRPEVGDVTRENRDFAKENLENLSRNTSCTILQLAL